MSETFFYLAWAIAKNPDQRPTEEKWGNRPVHTVEPLEQKTDQGAIASPEAPLPYREASKAPPTAEEIATTFWNYSPNSATPLAIQQKQEQIGKQLSEKKEAYFQEIQQKCQPTLELPFSEEELDSHYKNLLDEAFHLVCAFKRLTHEQELLNHLKTLYEAKVSQTNTLPSIIHSIQSSFRELSTYEILPQEMSENYPEKWLFLQNHFLKKKTTNNQTSTLIAAQANHWLLSSQSYQQSSALAQKVEQKLIYHYETFLQAARSRL